MVASSKLPLIRQIQKFKGDEVMSMTKVNFFGEAIETEDAEIIALDYCLTGNHTSKRDLIKKFDFKDRQISKILASVKFFQKIERSAKIAPAAISIGDNPIADKIIYSMNDTNTPPKGIVISASKGGNYTVLLLKNEELVTKPPKKGGKKCVVTEEMVIGAFKLRSENVTFPKVAEHFGVSQATIHRIIDRVYVDKFPEAYRKVDEGTPEPEQQLPLDESNDGLIEINVGPATVKCGLINERHPMPVELYVFNTFTQANLFDYPKIEEKSRDFIKAHVTFDDNGNAQQSITCYVTGLQCALAGFIKVCNEMRVNLNLMHYNASEKTYVKQVIWNCFENSVIAQILEKPLANISHKYVYKCSTENLIKCDTIYRIMITNFSKNTRDHEAWLCGDLSIATDAFNKALAQSIMSSDHIGIYLDRWDIKNGQFYKTKTMLKSQNY